VSVANEAELEELLSMPRAETVEALRDCPGDIVVLGAGGKMGPTLARMAGRAAAQVGDGRRVFRSEERRCRERVLRLV
jgi:hypothetical protein